MMQTSLGRKMRLLRAKRGLTLRSAADLCGVTKETLSALERGTREPHDPTLAKIAKGYGVPVEELIEEPVPLAEAPEAGPTNERGSGKESENASEEERRALVYARPWVFLLGRVAERLEGLSRGGFDAGAFVEAEDDVQEVMSALNIFMRGLEERGVDPMAGPVGDVLRAPMLRLSSAMQASALAIIHGLSEDELAQARKRRAERRAAPKNPAQKAAN
jgi:transcriptional regulator with XRE-family HTH domain